jgi:membrane protein YdbS with pleckstrin-like domain
VEAFPASDPCADRDGDRTPAAGAGIAEGREVPLAEPAASRDEAASLAAPLAGDQGGVRLRLPARVVRYWRWRAFYGAAPFLVLLISVVIALPKVPTWAGWGAVVVVVLATGAVAVLTKIRYTVFWYAISPTEIDIQQGIIFTERCIVPMHRVQTLQIERGPVADRYRLTNLKIRTAGGSVSVHGLDRDEADELCDRISRFARLADDV